MPSCYGDTKARQRQTKSFVVCLHCWPTQQSPGQLKGMFGAMVIRQIVSEVIPLQTDEVERWNWRITAEPCLLAVFMTAGYRALFDEYKVVGYSTHRAILGKN